MNDMCESPNHSKWLVPDYGKDINTALAKLHVPWQAGELLCSFHGKKRPYIALSDGQGVKWKIIPTFSRRKRVQSLRLHHRNSYGRRGFHSQRVWAWGTRSGLREVLAYVAQHETWRYHATRIENGSGTEHDWKKVAQTVEEIIADGVPPSNREVRELLLPIIEEMPDLGDPPDGLRLVLREIDRYLAARTTVPMEFIQEPSAEVKEVAKLLGGKSVVLIGGDRRSDSHAALKSAFGLKDLIWVETREHESTGLFKPFVARKDVVLVMLAIRWSSHSYADVRQYCGKYDKPLVRLPGGYNPNQVAFQVLQQSGLRLGNGRN